MTGPREALARRTANELLDELQIADVPVRPEEIVARKSLLFEEQDGFPPGVYGALFRSGNQFGIIVSRDCPGDGHRRFTIAHELGHYHIPDHIDRLFPNGVEQALSMASGFTSRKDPFEVEADYFANELLMPQRFAQPMIDSLSSGIAVVQEISQLCETSLSAAAIRYADLVRVPTVVLLSKDGIVQWAATSPALLSHRWANRWWKGDWAPRGSVTKRLGGAPARVLRGDAGESTTRLCDWFDNAPTELEATEEAMGLGAYGRVLTVITAAELPDAEDLEAEERDEEDHDWRDALRDYRLG